jgi:hypothetical protein
LSNAIGVSSLARRATSCAVVIVAAGIAGCGGPPMRPGDPPPVVSSINPTAGPASGGTAVQITGANFGPGAAVTFGGLPATNVVVESSTSIVATTPPRGVGAADVTVNVGGRVGTLGGAFTYQPGDPPVIEGITARGMRPNEPAGFADAGEEITVSATVVDPDTPIEQLQFQWTADVGTFSGSGASVTWRAPSDAPTPTTVTLSLTVSDGANTASTTTKVSVHNSIKEVGDLAREFLLDFSDSSKPASFVVRNFSKSPRCEAERDEEFSQIEENRRLYRITSSFVGTPSVTVQFASRPCPYEPRSGDACAAVPATWDSVCASADPKCTGGHVDGIDYVTAVYEQSEWRLCASYFQGRGATLRGFIR